MQLQLDHFGKIKHFIHFAQAGVLFLAWVLTIALFTRSGSSDGRVGWYFGLCWLTLPILIYLVMVPMWSRARRFSNVYAFACLDALSVILWLSAWAAVASYVSAGKGKGDKAGKTGCDNFKYGSPGRCELSETIIIFGVLEMLLFVATAFISFRALMTFKRTGMMPENLPGSTGKSDFPAHTDNDFSAQTQNDFSSNMRTDDEEWNDHSNGEQNYGYQKPSVDDEYAPIYQSEHDDVAHLPTQTPISPLDSNGLGIHNYDTSYNPGAYAGGHVQMPMPGR